MCQVVMVYIYNECMGYLNFNCTYAFLTYCNLIAIWVMTAKADDGFNLRAYVTPGLSHDKGAAMKIRESEGTNIWHITFEVSTSSFLCIRHLVT